MNDPKTEYLESIFAANEAHQKLIARCEMVVASGIEGIKEAAETHPNLILTCITTLVQLAQVQQKNYIDVVEDNFILRDRIEKLQSQQ